MERHVLLAVAVIMACRTRPAVLHPEVRTDTRPNVGAVAAKLLVDPAAPTVQLGPGEEYVPPQLTRGNPLPVYPPDLLILGLQAHAIAVRFVVDESRHVTDVSTSPVQESTESAYRSTFEASVHAALKGWSAWPAAIRKFRPGPDANGDGAPDYRILIDHRTLKAYFDVLFVFEVVNGEPVVRTVTAKP